MQDFLNSWIIPAVVTVLVLVFDVMVFRQYLERRKAHQLAWSIGFFLWAVATLFEMITVLNGSWDPTMNRFYMIMTVALVGFAALTWAAHARLGAILLKQ